MKQEILSAEGFGRRAKALAFVTYVLLALAVGLFVFGGIVEDWGLAFGGGLCGYVAMLSAKQSEQDKAEAKRNSNRL